MLNANAIPSTLLKLKHENYTAENLKIKLIKELEDLDIYGYTREDRFLIHKEYFEALINNNSIFKDLLGQIKNEYEECIDAILRGEKELLFVVSKLAETIGASPTLTNYQSRRKDLQKKILLLRQDNKRIRQKELLVESVSSTQLKDTSESFQPIIQQIPDLTIEEQMHIPTLKKKLSSVTQRSSKFKDEHKKRYYSKKSQQKILDRLLQKEEIKTTLEQITKSLELELCSLNVSFSEALQKVGKKTDALEKIANVLKLSKDADFVDIPTTLIEKEDSEDGMAESYSQTSSSDTEDIGVAMVTNIIRRLNETYLIIHHHNSQDTEILANCKATFQELLENKELEDAALLAAHAPKGVLRSKEIFNTLKEQGSEVLKIYWDALLPTLLIQHQKLSAWESTEYIKYSLENDEKQQLVHWIAQNAIDNSAKIADQIVECCRCTDGSCHCGLWGLALTVFTRIGEFKKVMACLLQQGRYLGALEYSSKRLHFNKKDLLEVFGLVPSRLLARKLSQREQPFASLFTIEETISILMKSQDDIILTCDLLKKAVVQDGYQIEYSAIDKPGLKDSSRETIQKWKDLYLSCWDLGLHSLAKKLFAYVIVKDVLSTAKKVHFVKRFFS